MSLANQGAGVSVTAVVFPACECGLPFTAHLPAGCTGYRPTRQLEDRGTLAFRPPGSWSLLKQWRARLLYRVERWARAAREAM